MDVVKWMDMVSMCGDRTRLQFFDALHATLKGEVVTPSGKAGLLFALVKDDILSQSKASREKAERIAERNRINGAKGGRPRKNAEPQCVIMQTSATAFEAELQSRGVEMSVIRDFIAVRRSKGIDIDSCLLVDEIEAEADKAGVGFAEAVGYAVQRGWSTFKANWWINKEYKRNTDGTGYNNEEGNWIVSAAKKIAL